MDPESIINRLYISSVARFLRQCMFNMISVGPIPTHIAFFMDGNRWPKEKQNLSLVAMLMYCYELGIKYVTVYAISIEDFKRKSKEIQPMMDLVLEMIELFLNNESIVHRFGIRLHFAGNLMLLTDKLREAAQKVMKVTANNDKFVILVSIAYTSTTDEVAYAVGELCQEKLAEGDEADKHVIRLSDVEKNMSMAVAPEPDIVIQRSRLMPLNNFFSWLTSYSLFYSPAALWPDLGLWHLVWGVLSYQRSFAYLEKTKKQS